MTTVTWHGKQDARADPIAHPQVEEPTDPIIELTSTHACGSALNLYDVLGAFMNPGDIPAHAPMGTGRAMGPKMHRGMAEPADAHAVRQADPVANGSVRHQHAGARHHAAPDRRRLLGDRCVVAFDRAPPATTTVRGSRGAPPTQATAPGYAPISGGMKAVSKEGKMKWGFQNSSNRFRACSRQ